MIWCLIAEFLVCFSFKIAADNSKPKSHATVWSYGVMERMKTKLFQKSFPLNPLLILRMSALAPLRLDERMTTTNN